DHLLYIADDSDDRSEVPLPFIQRNRDRWWEQQKTNSATFYFTPYGTYSQCVWGRGGTFAFIMIFLQTHSRLRLPLLHCRYLQTSVSIMEHGTKLRLIESKEIYESGRNELRLQQFDLDRFGPGRHELDVVVEGHYYGLRNIMIEFFEDDPPSDDTGDGNA